MKTSGAQFREPQAKGQSPSKCTCVLNLEPKAPATGFTNIHKLDGRYGAPTLRCPPEGARACLKRFCAARRAFGLLPQCCKETRLRGASHHDVLAGLKCLLERPGFTPTQRRMQRQRFVECRDQRLGLGRHGLVAIANKSGHGILAGTGVGQQPGLAEIFRASGVFAPATCWVLTWVGSQYTFFEDPIRWDTWSHAFEFPIPLQPVQCGREFAAGPRRGTKISTQNQCPPCRRVRTLS